jgi:membrane-associated phospholipid phosphatase
MFTYPWNGAGSRHPLTPRDRNTRRKGCALTLELLEDRCLLSGDMVLRWNEAALAAVRTAGQNPPVGARSEAIVQAAVFEAVNSIDKSYNHYLVDIPAPAWASKEAAAAEAAHDALVGLFPAQQLVLDLELRASLQGIPNDDAKTSGIDVGHAAAQIMLAVRAHDGSDRVVTYTPGTEPGDWQPTPPAFGPPLVPQWPSVTPFALERASQFRPPAPPPLTSAEYAAAFNQIKELGALDSPTRTADQTEAALFWQGVVTPNAAGWWNEIAQRVAVERGNSLVDNARLFALLNLAQADALIASFDGKYTYNFWRPVTAIRAVDQGNPNTERDPSWTPLMATPSHPSYPSNHATNSTAAAVVLASFFGTDAIPFSFSWEGLPGVTRSFDSFSAAAHEAGLSRIWAGFHWSFDITAGEPLGSAVGDYVFQNYLQPQGGQGGGGSSPSTSPPPVPGHAPQTFPALADGSGASLVPVFTSANFFGNGAMNSSEGRSLVAGPSTADSPTEGDWVRLAVVDADSQGEFANTPSPGALDGRFGGRHPHVSRQSLDLVFSSPELWAEGLRDD